MITRLTGVSAVFLLFSSAGLALDPELAALTMPGAKVLAGVNVDQARLTPFGQYVLSRLSQNESALQQFDESTGFDPRRDIREILIASTADTSAGRPPSLLLVRGAFDADRLSAAAQSRGLEPGTYNGITVLNDTRRNGSIGFLTPNLVVAGNADDVRATIDRRGTPTTLDAALGDRANVLSSTQDVWIVSSVPPSVSGIKLPDPTLQGIISSGLLNAVGQTSAGVKFGDSVAVTAEAVANTAQDATSLASVLRLLIALAQNNVQGTPQATLLQSLTVNTTGNTVQLALSIPESQVEEWTAARRRARALRRR